MLGRGAALAELRFTLDAAVRGTGGCVVVEGAAGIGKSRLLAAVADEAREREMTVAVGRATELDRVVPLASLLRALQSSQPPVLDNVGLARLVGRESSRFWQIEQLCDLVETYTGKQPLLITLDDAQWADEFTALTLRILVSRLSTSPVLWLLACRPLPEHSPANDALDSLVAEGARRLLLEPLSGDEVVQMTAEVLGAVPDDALLALAARSGGNPFLLEELLRALREEGRIVITGETATIVDETLPMDFLTAVDKRLGGLSEDAWRLVETGSVLGRPFTVHEAASLMRRPAVELVVAAEEAIRAGTLVDREAKLEFRHDLIREAVYGRLPEAVRQAVHLEAAAVLRTEGGPAGETATHMSRSAHAGDRQVVVVLNDAVRELAPTAPSAAADLLLRTLQVVEEHERLGLVAVAVRLLAAAGRLVEATELGESGLGQEMDPSDEALIMLGLAEAYKHAGQNTAAVEYTRRALARPGVPDQHRAELLAVQAHALFFNSDIDGADSAANQAVEVGRRVGADAAVVFGAAVRSGVLCDKGRLEEALALTSEAVRIAEGSTGEVRQRHPRLWLGAALVAVDRFVESDTVFEIGQREAEELGTSWSLPLWHFYRADLRLAAGRLDDGAAEAEAGVQVAGQLNASALIPSLLATLGHIAVRRDDLETARRCMDRAQQMVADGIGGLAEHLSWALAVVQEASGNSAGALESLTQVYTSLPERLLLLAMDPGAAPHMVRIAMSVGATNHAEAVVEAARRLAELNPGVASLVGAAAHAEGLLRGDLGKLRAAVQAYQSSPRRLAAASAIEDAAKAELGAGYRSQAVALLEEALGYYAYSNARRDETRVQRRLRRLGVRRRSSGQTKPKFGWSSLTEAELRVARLVADGLTNREVAAQLFLSPHTVDSHLRHAFSKLGISSRVELTRQILAQPEEE